MRVIITTIILFLSLSCSAQLMKIKSDGEVDFRVGLAMDSTQADAYVYVTRMRWEVKKNPWCWYIVTNDRVKYDFTYRMVPKYEKADFRVYMVQEPAHAGPVSEFLKIGLEQYKSDK